MLWKTQVTFQVFVFSEFAAKFTKQMTKIFYDIIYLQQMLCKHKT